MKKIISIFLLCLVLVFSFASCKKKAGSKNGGTDIDSSTSSTGSTESPSSENPGAESPSSKNTDKEKPASKDKKGDKNNSQKDNSSADLSGGITITDDSNKTDNGNDSGNKDNTEKNEDDVDANTWFPGNW